MGRFKRLSEKKATEFMDKLINKSYSEWPAIPPQFIVGYYYNYLVEEESGKTSLEDFQNWAFFRPSFISGKKVGDFYWLYHDGLKQQDVTIELAPDGLVGVWEDLEYNNSTSAANQDLSKILDDFELTGTVPNGSGNNWIWNPESTRRWSGIKLGRLENSRLIWGDARVSRMMISNLDDITSNPETINFHSIRYK